MTSSKHDARTMFAWRSAPFGKVRKVPAFEAARWSKRRERGHPRRWTYEQQDRLATLLDAGADYTTIARQLGRTRIAIQVQAKRMHMAMTKRPTVLTAHEITRILGLGCSKIVTRWIARGWLTATGRQAVGRTTRQIWAVQWDDLMTFLRNRATWMAWNPAQISDADLRAVCSALRADQPRWLSVGDVAERYCVGAGTVGQWIRKGWLKTTRYGNHYIWEADLDGWVAPYARSRAGIPRGVSRAVVGKIAIARRAA